VPQIMNQWAFASATMRNPRIPQKFPEIGVHSFHMQRVFTG